MGQVFLARHLRTGRPLAVKLLGAEAAREPEAVERFEREARVLGSLGLPGIVGIHDFDIAPGGRPYLVMDYLQDEELGARLARDGALPWSEASRIFEEVSGALHAAHGLGVLHRDLKPGNIFLARSAAAPERAVLLDFGLSKDLSAEEKRLTRTGMIMGTPLYMSPEQARGAALDVRSDLYSLAAVLYELVSGRPPFEGSSWTAILTALLLDPPAPFPDALLKNLPPSVDRAIRRALSKDPAFRPPDVLGFAKEVLGRPPVWAGALAVPESASRARTEGLATGKTSWADSGDLPEEEPGSARTLQSGPPVPAVALPAPASTAPAAGRARPWGARQRKWLLLFGGVLVVNVLLALAVILAVKPWAGEGGGGSGAGGGSGSGSGADGGGGLVAGRSPGAPDGAQEKEMPVVNSPRGRGEARPGAGSLPAQEVEEPRRAGAGPAGDQVVGEPRGSAVVPPEVRRAASMAHPMAPPMVPGSPRSSDQRAIESPPGSSRPAGEGPAQGAMESGEARARPPGRPLTEADVLARLPAAEQAIIAATKQSDWAGCIRASRQPPETERTLQMRVSCAYSAKRHDVVIATCKVFQKRFPSHPFSHSCAAQIRALEAAQKAQGMTGAAP